MKRETTRPCSRGVSRPLVALLAAGLMVFATSASGTDRPPDEPTICALEPGPGRAVTGVVDGETITLDDGSEVRLVGALSPRPPDSSLDLSFWPPEREAKAALEKLVLGRSVTLGFGGRRTDRYGRTLAQVFVESADGTRDWVQARMLAGGHARAFVIKDSTSCLRELAAHEAIARHAGKGLWSHAAYQPRDAARAGDLMRLRSTFQLVEGEVTAVVPGKTGIVLRFGPETAALANASADDDQRGAARSFSIFVRTGIARSWSAGGLTLDHAHGARLRIRGWIERRGGPAIEIVDPHQIELITAEPAPHTAVVTDTPAAPRQRSRRARREAAALIPTAN